MATVTELETRQRRTGRLGGPTVRAAIDAFLDTPKIKGSANTLRAYANVLDRAAETIGPGIVRLMRLPGLLAWSLGPAHRNALSELGFYQDDSSES